MALTDPSMKIFRDIHRPTLDHFRDKGWTYPVTAEIDLTLRCSLNCRGCHSKWLHAPTELNQGQIERILRQLRKHGCKSVTWSGGGEPLENKDWVFALTMAESLGYKQGLYSYLPSMTQERVDFISDRVSFVYGHNSTAKVGKPEGTNCRWTCGWLLDDKNWHLVPEMVGKVNWNLFDYVDFRPLILDGMSYDWVPQAIDVMKKAAENPTVKWAEYKFEDLLKPNYGRNYDKCYSTDFVAVVGSDGTMWECINRRGVTSIGNLLKENLVDIWARKEHVRCELKNCRMLCRNHEINKKLSYVMEPVLHEEFA